MQPKHVYQCALLPNFDLTSTLAGYVQVYYICAFYHKLTQPPLLEVSDIEMVWGVCVCACGRTDVTPIALIARAGRRRARL